MARSYSIEHWRKFGSLPNKKPGDLAKAGPINPKNQMKTSFVSYLKALQKYTLCLTNSNIFHRRSSLWTAIMYFTK